MRVCVRACVFLFHFLNSVINWRLNGSSRVIGDSLLITCFYWLTVISFGRSRLEGECRSPCILERYFLPTATWFSLPLQSLVDRNKNTKVQSRRENARVNLARQTSISWHHFLFHFLIKYWISPSFIGRYDWIGSDFPPSFCLSPGCGIVRVWGNNFSTARLIFVWSRYLQ